MHISRLFAGLTAVALLNACSDSGRPAPAQSTPTRPAGASAGPRASAAVDPASLFVQIAQCYRAHGHPDFPDPVQGPDGSWGFPVTADRVRTPAECAGLVRGSKELSPGAKDSGAAADLTQGRAFAKCMRDNGIPDWPDPNPDGRFTIPARLSDPSAENQWRPKASGPCKQFQPDGGPDIVMATAR